MKNLKIGAKIWIGFSCILFLLLILSFTSIISSFTTGSNIDEEELYLGMQDSANDFMHIINETRITTAVFYENGSLSSYNTLSNQLLYSDFRLEELYSYIDSYPLLSGFRKDVEEFEKLYTEWKNGVLSLGINFNLEEELTESELISFNAIKESSNKINLMTHESISKFIYNIASISDNKFKTMKSFHDITLIIVLMVSVISLFSTIILAIFIIRSISPPIQYMRSVLNQIGQNGDLTISTKLRGTLNNICKGKDETAECVSALLVLIDHLHNIDKLLSFVADGDLTSKLKLQSDQDTMGLAVDKMVKNLSGKFITIVDSIISVKQKVAELADGTRLLSDGSKTQAESVEHLSDSVTQIVNKIEENKALAKQATDVVGNIEKNANSGTEQMERMTQAAIDINNASQSIAKVIKVIDDIAFQTNILALNAAVEAARAGQHGKGFSVVAEEVRNLANKSAEAAKETGHLIENTIQKAALGSSIAEATSESLEKIVQGIKQSGQLINEMAVLSEEQSYSINQIINDVEHVEKIVEQNDTIATQSAEATDSIFEQSNVLSELVEQFKLSNSSSKEFRGV